MQIDLEPREYAPQSKKGEPVFLAGAGRRVLVWCLLLALCFGIGVIVQFALGDFANAFGVWLANTLLPS